ncbi:trimeric intracellular cation channel family protein [Cereibacter sphaeroides]|uniref:trimeric intracellular cation channel family protein n=1 Tax=Cereibacter sphaeroides TaxID=1063 RepID=UPI001F175623|nr:trimeric intracellular cation channel family protein [Cereibacter sphaeroides]MCE6950303.1 trimeric intracellular cation channel family protein [Cereibacter sphaeroides]
MEPVLPVLVGLDLASAVVFAITGALVASRKQMDIVGFLWLGMVTGVGGGTLRDLLLGVPVFWVVNPLPVALCLGAAALVHFSAHLVHSRYRLLLYLDAFGMALVTIAGTAKGLDAGAGPLVAVVMGVITAAVGGILRDTLGQEPSILLRREVYVSDSAAGSLLFILALAADLPRLWAMAAGLLAAFLIRSLAIRFDWALPVYRSRPGRTPGERGEVE